MKQPNPTGRFKHNNRFLFSTITKPIVGETKKVAKVAQHIPGQKIVDSKNNKYITMPNGSIVKL